jgi:hypothetical protein
MRTVDLMELQAILRQTPVMVEIHPLSLAFLSEDVRVYADAWQMAAALDMPTPQPTEPMLAVGIEPSLQHRLPAVRCAHDPLTTELNRVLLKRYEVVRANMLSQSQLADRIVREADAETIILMLVDGLAYADVKRCAPEWLSDTTPVLVDGVSITEHGMSRIVGEPTLAQRLLDAGYRHLLGFTYWERAEEPLTDRLFTGFGDRVRKVKSFDEALATLQGENLTNAFVQIVRTGLDSAAHRQREKPTIDAVTMDVLSGLERLAALCERKGVSARVYLTSDHGILWAHEHRLQVYEYGDADHPRHYEYHKRSQHVLNVEFGGKAFAVLEYPYLRRELRANEWGVHGGLSFEESVVPLIRLTVGTASFHNSIRRDER